jgi:small redox-active disulfide protein 2
MEIKVLGSGCENCIKLKEMVKKAVKEIGIEARVEKISDLQEIMKYTMTTPALVINGKLRHYGKPLPDGEKIKELIKSEAVSNA